MSDTNHPLYQNPDYVQGQIASLRSLVCVFQTKLDTRSTANWTRVPRQTGQLFQRKLDTDSTANWTVIPAQTGQA